MENDEILRSVTAREVTIEVTDEKTGRTLRRTLPIDYIETANGLRLRGEDINGNPAELVFFSSAGLGHLRDMTGGGADSDPCGGHGGK